LEVDDQLVLRWQLNWKIARLLALENAPGPTSNAPAPEFTMVEKGCVYFLWAARVEGNDFLSHSARRRLQAS
jgi:hypothetical protein